MSIDDLGMSLLAQKDEQREDSRRRARKQEKRVRRTQLIGAVGGIAINIGNKVLAEKTNDFMNSEQVFNERIKIKVAARNAGIVTAREKAIQASGSSTKAFFAEQARAMIKEKADLLYEEEKLDADAYNRYITEQGDIYGEKMALQHNEALRLADRTVTSESFENIIEMANKRPKNVGEYLTNLFRGKSKQDIDDEAFEAIKNHASTQNAEEFMEVFEGEYAAHGDVVRAHDFANNVFPGKVSKTFTTIEFTTQISADSVTLFKKTNHFNTNSDQWLLEKLPFNVTMERETYDMRTPEEIDIAETQLVTALNANFNYGERGLTDLTPKAFELFRAIVPDYIHLERITNIKDLGIVADAWAKMVSVSSNLNSTGGDEIAKEAFGMLSSSLGSRIKALESKLAETPEKRNTLTKEFILELAKDVAFVQQNLGGATLRAEATVGRAGTRATTTSTTINTPPSTGNIIVTDTDGKDWAFDTQEAADEFKRDSGLL
tara:strand:+ start:6193 stop:7665 length:1473 start_codon:yes stop_codon:yes gene_type:complete